MEENAQEATRKERGKQHKYQLKYQNIPIKIKTLFAYLEKLLYFYKSFCKKIKNHVVVQSFLYSSYYIIRDIVP